MHLAYSKSLAAGFAAAFLSVASASAAVPSLERQGLPAPTEVAREGLQLASVCGTWQSNTYRQSENCLDLWPDSDPEWVKQGDRGSQDDSFDTQHSYSSSQGSNDEDNDQEDQNLH